MIRERASILRYTYIACIVYLGVGEVKMSRGVCVIS